MTVLLYFWWIFKKIQRSRPIILLHVYNHTLPSTIKAVVSTLISTSMANNSMSDNVIN